MRKRYVFLLAIMICLLILCPTVYSATYSAGTYNGLTVVANSDFAGGTYTIRGDFRINSGVTLTVKNTATVNVTGDIVINGRLITSEKTLDLYLNNDGGNISINNTIMIYGAEGGAGSNGAPTDPGEDGGTGTSSNLYITAKTGSILINGNIINTGGTGGKGGKGGRSDSGFMWFENGGNGGRGGVGGRGGSIQINAKQGNVEIKKTIKSVGGTGGEGGMGGDDKTIAGGPGNGGPGGRGGNGGPIIVAGQDVIMYSTGSFDVSTGSGGAGGAGGTGGSAWSDGDPGPDGAAGITVGSVAVKAGEVYYGSNRVTNLTSFTITPSGATKTIEYDQANPDAPGEVYFVSDYEDSGIYYVKSTSPTIQIEVPNDNGLTVGADEYVSGIKKFVIEAYEENGTKLFSREEVFVQDKVVDGFFPVTLNVNKTSAIIRFDVITYDHFDRNTKFASDPGKRVRLYIDTVAPPKPEITSSLVTDRTISFGWNALTDASGIAGYDVYVNNAKVNSELVTGTSYSYLGQYNQQIEIKVRAWDRVGNVSDFSSIARHYTFPAATHITSVEASGTAAAGYHAAVTFTSVGWKAAGYEIQYWEVDDAGKPVPGTSSQTRLLHTIPAGENQPYTCTITDLEKHKKYRFSIRTKNLDELNPKYSDWNEYSKIVEVPNNSPTAAELDSPANQIYITSKNPIFKAKAASDSDGDPLTYTFYFSNKTEGVAVTEVVDGFVTCSPTLVDGTINWYVKVSDGYTAIDSPARTVILDTIAPAKPDFRVQSPVVRTNQVQLTEINIAGSDIAKLIIWSNKNNEEIPINPVSAYTLTIPAVEGEQTIYMKAEDFAGNRSQNAHQVKIIYDKTAPKNPANINLVPGVKSIHLSWSGATDPSGTGVTASGVKSYKLKYAPKSTEEWSTEKTVLSTAYTIENIGDNAGYDVIIMTVDHAENSSAYSSRFTGFSKASVGTVELKESGYTSTPEGNIHYVDLKVDPGNAVNYTLVRKNRVTAIEEAILGPFASSTTLQRDQGVAANGNYQYKICTTNSSTPPVITESAWFDVALANNQPGKPVNTVSGFLNQQKPILRSTISSDPDGDGLTYYYRIEKETAPGAKTTVIPWTQANVLNTQYQPTVNLIDGSTYYYQVGVDDGHCERDEQNVPILTVVSDATSFVIDTSGPQVSVQIPEVIRAKVAEGQYVKEASVTIEAVDANPTVPNGAVSGLKELYYYWDSDENAKIVITSGETISVPNGIHTLYVVAEDFAGNRSVPVSTLFKVDHSGPVISTPTVVQGIEINGTIYTANSSSLAVTFRLTEDASTMKEVKYVIVTANERANLANLPTDRWKTVTLRSGIVEDYSILAPCDLTNDSEYYFVVKATNSVDRENIAISAPIKVDTVEPVIAFSDTSGTLPAQYRLSTLATWTLRCSASDHGSGLVSEMVGITEKRAEEGVAQWYSSISAIPTSALVNGKEYRLAVRAIDRLGLKNVQYSVPILFDSTAPVFQTLAAGDLIPGTDESQIQWGPTYLKVYWNISDETKLISIRYSVGSSSGGKQISSQWVGNDQGWFTVENPANEMTFLISDLNLSDGTYYINIEATNHTGLTSSLSSNPVVIDRSREPQPIVSDDGLYTDRKEIHFSVSFPEAELLEKQYFYEIVDETDVAVLQRTELPNPDQLTNVSVTVDEADGISFANGMIYYVKLGEMINGVFVPVSYSDGIRVDWTLPQFTAYEDGMYFTDQNVFLRWNALDQESGISKYYLKVGTTRGGSELADWMDLGTRTSTAVTDLAFADGNLYFATVKAVNGAGKEVIVMGDGFRIDTSAPPTPEIVTEGDYVTQLDRLAASWTWTPGDLGSGVVAYYYDYLSVPDLSQANWKPVEDITNDPLSTSLVLNGLSLTNGETYYIAVKAVNGAGLVSTALSTGIMADTEAPETPIITDFRDYQDFTDHLTAHFSSRDHQSQLKGFEYAIGTLENPTSEVDWREITFADETVFDLNLEEGKVYFFTALATDHASLRSATSRSDGILIDLQKPEIQHVQSEGEYTTNSSELFFIWDGVPAYTPIVAYEYYLSRTAGAEPAEWKSTSQEQILLKASDTIGSENFVEGEPYHFHVRARDAAGKVSAIETVSITIDSTPPTTPVISRSGEYQPKTLHLGWSSGDPETGIARYRYAIGSTRGGTEITQGWVVVEETGETVTITCNDLNLEQNQRYYLAVQAQNTAGAWSAVGVDNGFLVDLTGPVVTAVTGPDGYLSSTATVSEITFTAIENEVEITAYRYQIVLAADKETITTLTTEEISLDTQHSVEPKNVTITFDAEQEQLTDGMQYYIAIQTKNILNLWSEVGFSTVPFTVDVTDPVVTFEAEDAVVTNGESVEITWSVNELGKVYYYLKHPDGSRTPTQGYQEIPLISLDAVPAISFVQTEAGTYTLYLYAEDLAGNTCTEVSQSIRVNARPQIQVGGARSVYQGKPLALTGSDFVVSDADGTIQSYLWDFGDGHALVETTEPTVSHIYELVGDYTITLTVVDNDHGIASAELIVHVGNTLIGEVSIDETWSGTLNLLGDLTVPPGVTLTIEPGTTVVVPEGKGLTVNGTMIVGGEGEQVKFTAFSPTGVYGANMWKGIYLSDSSTGSVFSNVQIEYAERGLVLNKQNIQIAETVFQSNGIGLHLGTSSPTIRGSRFESNVYYGIKEEEGCLPILNHNTFLQNGLAPYYRNGDTLLTIEEINAVFGEGNQ